jgi:hypothetical protein
MRGGHARQEREEFKTAFESRFTKPDGSARGLKITDIIALDEADISIIATGWGGA